MFNIARFDLIHAYQRELISMATKVAGRIFQNSLILWFSTLVVTSGNASLLGMSLSLLHAYIYLYILVVLYKMLELFSFDLVCFRKL